MAHCGDIAVGDLTLEQAEAFRAALLVRFKPVTARSYLTMVRPPFRWWQVRHRAFYDHWSELPRIKICRTKPKMYTAAEIAAILAGAGDDELMTARVTLMLTTGMRRGEMLNLVREDVDFERGVIRIQPKSETSSTWRWVPKDKDCRDLPLVDQARDCLIRRGLAIPLGQPYWNLTADRYAYLMWLQSRGRLTDRNRRCPDENWRAWRQLRHKLGIVGKGNKHFRNTCLTHWLRDGLDVATVRDLAGHSSIETTEHYLVADSAVKKAGDLSSARLASIR
jgi:integrase